MGERYLIDTNVIIDYLAGMLPANGLSFLDTIFDSGDLILSVITQIEVVGFQAPADYLQKCQDLINVAEIIPLADQTIIRHTIEVRREARIKLPDAIIAATALARGLTLVSRNEKDFVRVSGTDVYQSLFTLSLISAVDIHIPTGCTYPLEQATEALNDMLGRRVMGKVLMVI